DDGVRPRREAAEDADRQRPRGRDRLPRPLRPRQVREHVPRDALDGAACSRARLRPGMPERGGNGVAVTAPPSTGKARRLRWPPSRWPPVRRRERESDEVVTFSDLVWEHWRW